MVTYDLLDEDEERLELGSIFHMNHIEENRVELSQKSLASHTFITGSTGSGKSSRALAKHTYDVTEDEAERCIATIDANLTSSNYPTLYPGNPYDFLILMAIRTSQPLQSFREYMHELFFKSVDLDSFYGDME